MNLSYPKSHFGMLAKPKPQSQHDIKEIPLRAEPIYSKDSQACLELFLDSTLEDIVVRQQDLIVLVSHNVVFKRFSKTFSANESAARRSEDPGQCFPVN